MGIQWVKFGLDVASAQWSTHMDLLDLWRNELSSISLSAYVARAGGDLSSLKKICNYYEQVLRLFAFDTGFEPLVAIYDGNIRQNQDLYAFFSLDPVYIRVSAAYYSSKLEDVNTQFTSQFLGNFGLIWGLFIPEMLMSALVTAPSKFFKSRANKILTQRNTALVDSGDFIKWASHCYSAAFKNYSPFICSAEMWRIYNPLIDLYWITLVSHVFLLKSLRSALPDFYVKPFIETQKTIITVNGEPTGMARLIGEGRICATIDPALLTETFNKVCFDTYGFKKCFDIMAYDMKGHFHRKGAGSTGTDYTRYSWDQPYPNPDWDMVINWGGYVQSFGAGFHWRLPEAVPVLATIRWELSSPLNCHWRANAGFYDIYGTFITPEHYEVFGSGSMSFHIPPRRYSGVSVNAYTPFSYPSQSPFIINEVTLAPDPDFPGPYGGVWSSWPDTDRTPFTW